MPSYNYSGRDQEGKEVTGVLEARDESAAIEQLQGRGYFVTSVAPATSERDIREDLERISLSLQVVTVRDMVVINRQLATMIRAGLTLTESLEILVEQTEKARLRSVLTRVREDVEAGSSFADALQKHPRIFSRLYVSMVRSGETGGILDEVLERLAYFSEQDERLRTGVTTALLYPVVIMAVAIGAVVFLLVKPVPAFVLMYSRHGAQLPIPTLIVKAASEFLLARWYMILLALGGIILAVYQYGKTEVGRRNLDRLKLRVPIFGTLLRKAGIARFSRTLSALIASGVPILEALEVVEETVGNVVLASAVRRTREEVNRGSSLGEPLRREKVMPPILGRMVTVGEGTGALDEMLGRIAELFEEDVNTMTARLSSLIEPILLIFVGGLVLFIALALYLPIFNMMQAVRF